MNYELYNDGTSFLGLVLVFGFLAIVGLFAGGILAYTAQGPSKKWGFYMIVAGVLFAIAALLIYSSMRKDLW